MVLPNQNPQYWDTYLPQPGDYETAQEYTDALAAGAEDTSPAHGAYYDPIAGVWRGGRRTEREIALSQYDSGRYMDPNNSFNKGPYAAMRLQNRISNNPDAARLAYGAYDEFGNPLIDPAILAVIEQQLGLGPGRVVSENPPSGEIPTDPTTPRPITQPPDLGFGDTPGSGAPGSGGGVGGRGDTQPSGGPADPFTPRPIDQPPDLGFNDSPTGGAPGAGGGGGRGPLPTDAPPPLGFNDSPTGGEFGMGQMSNAATINPLYPDFMLTGQMQPPPPTTADRLGLRNRRIPLGGLGAY
jgi:hypothetical protein